MTPRDLLLPFAVLNGVLPLFAITPQQQLAQNILQELVNINTADSAANVTAAAEVIATRLRNSGFAETDMHLDGDDPRFKNVVVRYAGTGSKKPILLLAHLDVVEALRSDWSIDPFAFTEKDGYFYGRGTVDDKAQAACWIANLILYKQEGYRPDRDIIVALTSGEESGEHNGVDWLLNHHRDWIDAALALNEGGDGAIRNSKKVANYLQASEKVYYSIELKAVDSGGHSSVPRKNNPIYSIASALTRIAPYEFPVELNEVTRAYFEHTGNLSDGPLAGSMRALARNPDDRSAIATLSADPHENAMMRTTCVATRVSGGHADNALPQSSTAIVNCRLLPEDKPELVMQRLQTVVGDSKIQMTEVKKPRIGPSSPLTPEVMRAVEQTTHAIWPGVPVIPVMSTGATDGRALREAGIPCYGVSGFFLDQEDNREHGKDERISVQSFFDGQQFLFELVKKLAGISSRPSSLSLPGLRSPAFFYGASAIPR
jgi:acetylornithine deacetylase/succinyl-diaminopimelate desuccinylase-like protein